MRRDPKIRSLRDAMAALSAGVSCPTLGTHRLAGGGVGGGGVSWVGIFGVENEIFSNFFGGSDDVVDGVDGVWVVLLLLVLGVDDDDGLCVRIDRRPSRWWLLTEPPIATTAQVRLISYKRRLVVFNSDVLITDFKEMLK